MAARSQPASDLPKLSKPARRALASAGIARLGQVAQRSEAELLALHGLGPTAIVALRSALAARGLRFRSAR
jgi:hypothetical protein